MIRPSADEYRNTNDLIGLEQLNLVEHSICGTWQWWRGTVALALIILMLALALTVSPVQSVNLREIDVSWGFIQASSILAYVLVIEIWMWYTRINARIAVDTLENMRDKYQLVPLQSANGDVPK